MSLKMSMIAIILLSTFTFSHCARIGQLRKDKEQGKFVKHAQMASRNDEEGTQKSIVKGKIDFKDRAAGAADGTEADSADIPVSILQPPAELVQEAVLQGVVPDNLQRNFSKTLHQIKAANWYSRPVILRAACDSTAFSCEEIIRLANSCWPWLGPHHWQKAVMVFVKGRDHKGCISDPVNTKSIVDSFEHKWPGALDLFGGLRQELIDNENLKPATHVGPASVQLQTGFRTDEDMQKLLEDMEGLQLENMSHWGTGDLYVPGSPIVDEFESWLKQIRAHGEQFSGSQLVSLINGIPQNSGTAPAICALVQHLEQYLTGITCAEVKQILELVIGGGAGGWFLGILCVLKSNIVDGQNKIDILAFTDSIFPFIPGGGTIIVSQAELVLRDVGVGLPPKNNPVFGLVEGNPVILVVDESTSMDAKIILGDGTSTPRKFCYSQLENVLKGLPNSTYFNVIQYSSCAVKIFEKTVLVNKANIDAGMEAMGTTWRDDYTRGLDPVEMIRTLKVFALQIKRRLTRSTNRNSMEALRLAYATASLRDHVGAVVNKRRPQIYFLTSGQPDGGASLILDNIDVFDNGRHIPVNSIAFIMPADPAAKQFAKDLANKTGGFFRSIEQASLYA